VLLCAYVSIRSSRCLQHMSAYAPLCAPLCVLLCAYVSIRSSRCLQHTSAYAPLVVLLCAYVSIRSSRCLQHTLAYAPLCAPLYVLLCAYVSIRSSRCLQHTSAYVCVRFCVCFCVLLRLSSYGYISSVGILIYIYHSPATINVICARLCALCLLLCPFTAVLLTAVYLASAHWYICIVLIRYILRHDVIFIKSSIVVKIYRHRSKN
jgi:hypothetical protein